MKFDRKQLIEILSAVRPAVSKRDIIIQQQHFIFLGDMVVAHNGNVTIAHPLETDFSTSVKAEDLFKILGSSYDESVDLSLDKDSLVVANSDTQAKLNTVVSDEAKITGVIEQYIRSEKNWKPVPTEFSDALYLCAFSASRNQTEGVATAVSVTGKNVYSTDTKRVSWYEMKEEIEPFLIRALDALELSNFVDIEKYDAGDNQLAFLMASGAMFVCSRVKGNHLPLEQVFAAIDAGTEPLAMPENLKAAVDASSALMENVKNDPTKVITVSLEPGQIQCKSYIERAQLVKRVLFEYTGAKIEFQVNPAFLSQVLEKSTTMSFHNMIKSGKPAGELAQFKTDAFRHLIILPLLQKGK